MEACELCGRVEVVTILGMIEVCVVSVVIALMVSFVFDLLHKRRR